MRLSSYLRLSGNLKRPQVHLKVAKTILELRLGTIPGRVGWGGLGPIMIIRLSQPASRAADFKAKRCEQEFLPPLPSS